MMMTVDDDGINEIIDVTDDGISMCKTIITKEAFIEAYNKWIKTDRVKDPSADIPTNVITIPPNYILVGSTSDHLIFRNELSGEELKIDSNQPYTFSYDQI